MKINIKQQLAEHLSEDQREQLLMDNCDSTEEMPYMKKFSAEEMLMKKELLAEVSIGINDLYEKKKEFVKAIEDEKKPLKKELIELRTNIKQKAVLVDELFQFKMLFEAQKVELDSLREECKLLRITIEANEKSGNINNNVLYN